MGKGKEQKNVLSIILWSGIFIFMMWWALTSEPDNRDFFNLKKLEKNNSNTILERSKFDSFKAGYK